MRSVTFPVLTEVRASFEFSTNADMSCDQLNPYYEYGDFQGDYNCTTASESISASDLQR